MIFCSIILFWLSTQMFCVSYLTPHIFLWILFKIFNYDFHSSFFLAIFTNILSQHVIHNILSWLFLILFNMDPYTRDFYIHINPNWTIFLSKNIFLKFKIFSLKVTFSQAILLIFWSILFVSMSFNINSQWFALKINFSLIFTQNIFG